ncbi:hypothetical protein HQ587_10425 [bacterium]|nr:hypothetical protein [bacterium]
MPPLKKNEKVMLVMIGIVVIVFAVMDPYYIWKTKPEPELTEKQKERKEQKEKLAAAKETATQKRTVTEQTKFIPKDPIPLKGWGRDPFVQARPDLDEENILGKLRLSAISVQGDSRMALINSKLIRVGDVINGLKVNSIETERVILTSGNRTYQLTWEK